MSKAVINGLKYDTETADFVGTLESSTPYSSDFEHWSGSLYRTKRSKRFFLEGGGGPMSMFYRSTGQNSWSGGCGIIALSRDEALELCEDRLDCDVTEKFFDIEEA